MPPKGWRKNADGQYPQVSKESEIISIDDILFPKATVMKLAKNITSGTGDDNMILAKDSGLALQRSATVFVSHLMFHAREVAKEQDRKTVNAQDILNALERAEFNGFTGEVKQKLSAFENNTVLKKKQRLENKSAKVEDPNTQPAAKKLKDNSEQGIQKLEDKIEHEEEEEEEEEDNFEDANDDANDEEDVDGGEEEGEVPQSNPIAILGQEENELGGEEYGDQNDAKSGESSDEE